MGRRRYKGLEVSDLKPVHSILGLSGSRGGGGVITFSANLALAWAGGVIVVTDGNTNKKGEDD